MRTVFKTSYDADINLFRHRRAGGWYLLLLVLAILAAVPDRHVLARRDDQRADLGDRRHGPDGAGRADRPGEPRPCRLPRHRLLRQRAAAGAARPAVHPVVPARGADRRHRRRADRDADDQAARHLSRHRHPGGRDPDGRPDRHRGTADARRRRPVRADDRHLRPRVRPLRRRPTASTGWCWSSRSWSCSPTATSCARRSAAPSPRCAIRRFPRRRWASTWRAPRRPPSASRPPSPASPAR